MEPFDEFRATLRDDAGFHEMASRFQFAGKRPNRFDALRGISTQRDGSANLPAAWHVHPHGADDPLLLAGQIVGQAIWGPSGAMWGALIGSLVGFVFGVYSVYITIGYLDTLDSQTKQPRKYLPPMEEILEDVKFDLDSPDTESGEDE